MVQITPHPMAEDRIDNRCNHNRNQQMRGQIGAPIALSSSDDTAVRAQAMGAIATMLPASMRGLYMP